MRKTLRPYQQDCIDELKGKLKETTSPGCVVASVGAGKSLIIAELLLMMEKANYRALCLTLNSDLIRQNVATYRDQGGKASIYCAALKEKDASAPIVFASPHSIHKGIKSDKNLKELRFNLIIIDECHNVNTNDKSSMYMRLLNHYGHLAQMEQYSFRVVGLTGTPFRGKGFDIVGDNAFFKYKVGNITTEWLIEHGYLVDPTFGLRPQESYDFSNLRVMSTGQFSGKDLQREIDKQRLTGKLMNEVVEVVSKRNGAFIFASTIEHCKECLRALPPELSAMITGETPSDERNLILNLARSGDLKYLVNVNVLTVGIDVPNFDTVVFVRPTESLVLYTQAIGRGLRLHESKRDCLILDYAGNLERHGDLDHPIINKALTEWSSDGKDYCIPCFDCGTFNTMHARRCIGMIHKETKKTIKDEETKKERDLKQYKRCDHYFEFKECFHCQAKNDKVSRHCWRCKNELIDPNANLSPAAATVDKTLFKVLKATYNVRSMGDNRGMIFSVYYTAIFAEDEGLAVREQLRINETYTLSSENARNVFYHKFLKQHYDNYKRCYLPLRDGDWNYFKDLIQSGDLKTPYEIECVPKEGFWRVMNKHFSDEEIVPQTPDRTVNVMATSLQWVHTSAKTIFGFKLEVSYYCEDVNGHMFTIKDKYSITAKPDNRLLKDSPELYKEIYKNKENMDKALEVIRSWTGQYLFKSPEKLVINQHGTITGRIGETKGRMVNTGFVLNEHIYEPGWQIVSLKPDPISGDDCVVGWKDPKTGEYMMVHAFVEQKAGLRDLYANHQIKEVELVKHSKYHFSITRIHLIDGSVIRKHYDF